MSRVNDSDSWEEQVASFVTRVNTEGVRELEVDRELRTLLGGLEVHQGRSRPDIFIPGGDTGNDIIIEVHLWPRSNVSGHSHFPTQLLLGQSVSYRRSFSARSLIVSFLIFSPASQALPQPLTEEKIHTMAHTMAHDLLRSHDDAEAGFDAVVIGSMSDPENWYFTEASSGTTGNESLSWCLQHILSLAPSWSKTTSHATGGNGAQSSVEPHKEKFLLINDEWGSGKGGLSTINRNLALALSAHGCKVAVYVADANDAEQQEAENAGVELIKPDPVPGISDKMQLLLTKPRLPKRWGKPDYIIGHGRVSGPYALSLKSQFYPDAKRIHVVHTKAEELEYVKGSNGASSPMEKADQRRGIEDSLARSSDLVVGIGPRLSSYISDEMNIGNHPKVVTLIPGFPNMGNRVSEIPQGMQVLVMGRAEDWQSKGLDIAAKAVFWAYSHNRQSTPITPYLVIRGVKVEDEAALGENLKPLLSDALLPHFRPYNTDQSELLRDIGSSRVVLMPSKHEGFGLSAYEAMAVDVPVLITRESGLADILKDTDYYNWCCLPTHLPNPKKVVAEWGKTIYDRLIDPKVAFDRAKQLGAYLTSAHTWDDAVETLLKELSQVSQ